MSKVIRIGDVQFDAQQYAINGTGILGIKKSGKSWLAKGIAEQMLIAGIPIIVFDAIGVWRHLKRAVGSGGRGFPIVVAGGEEPDLPLTVANAKEIVRAAIRENIPLVIDLFDKNLSKADWRRIVQMCFRTLLFENVGVRHIFLEEAAEYVPQRVTDGETFAEVEKLVRMGGNRSLGITLINPRAQEINKAVLELCENLVCMKQRGAHAIDSLEKWMDRLDPGQAKAIAASLPKLKTGECWLFTGEDDAVHRTRSGPLLTFHPDRSKPEAGKASRAAVVNDDLVARLRTDLAVVLKEAEANDPKALRARIAELERERGKTFVTGATHTKADLNAEYTRGREDGFDAGLVYGQNLANNMRVRLLALDDVREKLTAISNSIRDEIDGKTLPIGARAENPTRSGTHPVRSAPTPARPAPRARQIDARAPSSNGELTSAERKVLTVLSQHEGCEIGKLALLTGYAVTGGAFRNTLGALRTRCLLEGENTGVMRITDEGLHAGPFDEMPAGEALRQHWLSHSSFGKSARESLAALLENPLGLTLEQIALYIGKEPTGGAFRNGLGELRTAGVLVGKNTGVMTASEELLA